MSTFKGLFCKAVNTVFLSTISVVSFSAIASAQQITTPDAPIAPADFSQELTDSVTQGFREQRDRLFFDEGIEQFEQEIRLLQTGENAEAILTVGPVFDNWESLEMPAGSPQQDFLQ